ncbi:MAG: pentapeptide repeat-containing protein [Halopseudomonas sp.]
MKLCSLAVALAITLATPAWAYDSDDLRKLQIDKKCNGCDLEGANLRGMSLRGAEIRWSNLSNANLNNVDLTDAELVGSDLTRARVSNTRFNGANMQGVQFKGTDLSSAQFRNTDLRWSLMEHLDIDSDPQSLDMMSAQMEGAKFRNDRRCSSFAGQVGMGCIPDFR